MREFLQSVIGKFQEKDNYAPIDDREMERSSKKKTMAFIKI